MRTLFFSLALLVLLAAPARAALDHDLYLDYGRTSGHAAGRLATGELRAFPLKQSTVDLRYRLEGMLGHSAAGTPIVLWTGFTLGWLIDQQITTPPTVAHESGLRWSVSAGTLLPLVLTERLLVALNFSTDCWVSRPSWWANDSFLLSFAGGVEVVYGAKDLKGRLRYDVVPFWIGTDRIEHKLGVSLSFLGVAVHGGFGIGQQRFAEGGFNERTISVGLGWQP